MNSRHFDIDLPFVVCFGEALTPDTPMGDRRSVFPTDDSLFKMLYLAMCDITKKWTGRRQDWSGIYARLVIYYGDRMPE